MGSYHDRDGGRQMSACARFTIGRDHHGWWVVRDRLDRVGGYFVSEEAARHFAAAEADHNPSEICTAFATEDIELFGSRKGNGSIGESILDNNRRLRQSRDQSH
jgi:hypothetical protein